MPIVNDNTNHDYYKKTTIDATKTMDRSMVFQLPTVPSEHSLDYNIVAEYRKFGNIMIQRLICPFIQVPAPGSENVLCGRRGKQHR